MADQLAHLTLAIDWLADAVENEQDDELGEALRRVLAHWKRDPNFGPVVDAAIGRALERIRRTR
jgi:hypothetical protein